MLRDARPADLPQIAALLDAAQLPTEGVAALIGSFVVADEDGTVAGAGGLEIRARDALLRSLVVAEGLRGRGLGSRICDRLENMARRGGLTGIYLLTETAEAFFLARGYVRIDRAGVPAAIASTGEFARLCPATAACMLLRTDRESLPD